MKDPKNQVELNQYNLPKHDKQKENIGDQFGQFQAHKNWQLYIITFKCFWLQYLLLIITSPTSIKQTMNSQGLDYMSRQSVSSPLFSKKSPSKYIPYEPKYIEPYVSNKSVHYSSHDEWANPDFHSLKRVPDEVNHLRQTFDFKTNSKIQNILSKHDYDNQESTRSINSSQFNLRHSLHARPKISTNRINSLNFSNGSSYYSSNTEGERLRTNLKSPERSQKFQIQYNKYKEQLQELQVTKKMAEQLRRLKEDRRKRLQASLKEAISSLEEEEKKVNDFKKKKFESYYSPKYEKSQSTQMIQYPKTVPTKNDAFDKYKTQPKVSYFSLTHIEDENSPKMSKQNSHYSHQPKKQIEVSPKLSLKGNRKISINLNLQSTHINDFIMGKTLGEGRFGSVHQVLHKETGAMFALKKIPKENVKKLNLINQLVLELKLQTFLHHQNVVALYHHFDDQNYIYLLLEYMEQGTLYSLLKKKKALPQQEVSQKIQQIAMAINYLHKNQIAHRDIKPQNIVITNGVCKVCDFGWATVCDSRRKTRCGTFDYTPPEIFEGEQYDYTVDLWCLGVLTYELLVGRPPFYHISREQTKNRILNVEKTIINYPESLSKKAINFIESLIKRDPQDRLSSEDVLNHPFLPALDKKHY